MSVIIHLVRGTGSFDLKLRFVNSSFRIFSCIVFVSLAEFCDGFNDVLWRFSARESALSVGPVAFGLRVPFTGETRRMPAGVPVPLRRSFRWKLREMFRAIHLR